jgi:putative transposase
MVLRKQYGPRGAPSAAAIGRWLQAWRLSYRKPRRGARCGPVVPRPHLTVAAQPNDVWSVDFKGWFRTGEGRRADPLTVRDMATCFIIGVELVRNQSVEHTQAAFVHLFRQYGLPAVIRVDNGCPFGADGALGLTRLSAWWIRLGVRVEFITPGCPGENAAHEQMHQVYKAEMANPPASTIGLQRRRTRNWVREYNEIRPHEALGMLCPAQLYTKSARKLPKKLPALRYGPDWLSRLVKGQGMINLHGRRRFVGEAFEGERVGLKRTSSGWEVYFGHLLIGTLAADDQAGIHAVRYRHQPQRRSNR